MYFVYIFLQWGQQGLFSLFFLFWSYLYEWLGGDVKKRWTHSKKWVDAGRRIAKRLRIAIEDGPFLALLHLNLTTRTVKATLIERKKKNLNVSCLLLCLRNKCYCSKSFLIIIIINNCLLKIKEISQVIFPIL